MCMVRLHWNVFRRLSRIAKVLQTGYGIGHFDLNVSNPGLHRVGYHLDVLLALFMHLMKSALTAMNLIWIWLGLDGNLLRL